MNTVIVSIGRNCGSIPLSKVQWDKFVARTTSIVLNACGSFGDIHFTGKGQGWYQGQAEESFTIIATIDAGLVDELKARLSILAHVFGQDSIAVTTGTTDIVTAVKSRRG